MEAPQATAPVIQAAPAATQAIPRITPEERRFLMEHGYLVKLNVIPEDECERIQNSFEEAFSLLNPAKKGVSPKNWAQEDLPANMHGIQEMSKLAHLSCIKDVRMHPHVVSCWRSLLRTDDISTSWDRINYMPIGYSNGARVWHHTDVGPAFFRREDLAGYTPIQSYVQLSKTSTNTLRTEPLGLSPTADPCIVLWEHSNLAHAEYFRKKGSNFDLKTANWHIYPDSTIAKWEKDGREWLPEGHSAKKCAEAFPMRKLEVRAPRGAIVFWLSQTAHMNTTGTCPNPRFVVYVCYGPSALVSRDDREKFWRAMREQKCTSHWPGGDQMKVFPETAQHLKGAAKKAFDDMAARLDVPALTFSESERQLIPKPLH